MSWDASGIGDAAGFPSRAPASVFLTSTPIQQREDRRHWLSLATCVGRTNLESPRDRYWTRWSAS